MTDWLALASARNVSPEDLGRLSNAVAALEAEFRPLVARIPHATEPAVILSESAVEAAPGE